MTYSISNHAKERYAERVMNRQNIIDIRKFVNDHDDDIEKWINELIEHGDKVYIGPLKDKNCVEVYLNGLWVVIAGPTKKVVITLYKIDFGDDEVNELFISKMRSKIDYAHEAIEFAIENSKDQVASYQEMINSNNEEIRYQKQNIKNMEEMNEAYETLIDNAQTDVKNKKRNLQKIVEQLTCKQEF
ncbi:hypothetical protein [Longibaculum muris]|uniref:hypothetical protein n=1 Tax=Longibaculum muris TaxID=1796628 RepID=UPI0022E64779|nr:hypothetical protein [Longibaculum muris]